MSLGSLCLSHFPWYSAMRHRKDEVFDLTASPDDASLGAILQPCSLRRKKTLVSRYVKKCTIAYLYSSA